MLQAFPGYFLTHPYCKHEGYYHQNNNIDTARPTDNDAWGRLCGATPGELEHHIPTPGCGSLLKPEYFTQDHLTTVVTAVVGASRCHLLLVVASVVTSFTPTASPPTAQLSTDK
jgi:hypothetical protein